MTPLRAKIIELLNDRPPMTSRQIYEELDHAVGLESLQAVLSLMGRSGVLSYECEKMGRYWRNTYAVRNQ